MSLAYSISHWLTLLVVFILVLVLWRLLRFYETSEYNIQRGWRNEILILFLSFLALALGIVSAILLMNISHYAMWMAFWKTLPGDGFVPLAYSDSRVAQQSAQTPGGAQHRTTCLRFAAIAGQSFLRWTGTSQATILDQGMQARKEARVGDQYQQPIGIRWISVSLSGRWGKHKQLRLLQFQRKRCLHQSKRLWYALTWSVRYLLAHKKRELGLNHPKHAGRSRDC